VKIPVCPQVLVCLAVVAFAGVASAYPGEHEEHYVSHKKTVPKGANYFTIN
jgi:hypothetical protein